MRSFLASGLLLIIGSGCQAEVANPGEKGPEFADQRAIISCLKFRLETVSLEDSAKTDRINALQLDLDHSNTLLAKYEADMQALVRLLDAQLAQITELTNNVDAYRTKLVKIMNVRTTLVPELDYLRQKVSQLEKQRADQKDK